MIGPMRLTTRDVSRANEDMRLAQTSAPAFVASQLSVVFGRIILCVQHTLMAGNASLSGRTRSEWMNRKRRMKKLKRKHRIAKHREADAEQEAVDSVEAMRLLHDEFCWIPELLQEEWEEDEDDYWDDLEDDVGYRTLEAVLDGTCSCDDCCRLRNDPDGTEKLFDHIMPYITRSEAYVELDAELDSPWLRHVLNEALRTHLKGTMYWFDLVMRHGGEHGDAMLSKKEFEFRVYDD